MEDTLPLRKLVPYKVTALFVLVASVSNLLVLLHEVSSSAVISNIMFTGEVFIVNSVYYCCSIITFAQLPQAGLFRIRIYIVVENFFVIPVTLLTLIFLIFVG